MDAAEVDVGGDGPLLQDREKILGVGFEQEFGADGIKGGVADGDDPAATGF